MKKVLVHDRANGKPDLPEVILNQLLTASPGITVSTAESCTGGNIAARITSVSGSSIYFTGGLVAYDNAIKERLLDVPAEVLERFGAVSSQCAEAMATGARAIFRTAVAVASTGVAGPGGGSEAKPIGLVYLAVATDAGASVFECRFDGDRQSIVAQATDRALQALVKAVETAVAS